jgi:hypothetical protein
MAGRVTAFESMPTKVGIYQSSGMPGSRQPWLALAAFVPTKVGT